MNKCHKTAFNYGTKLTNTLLIILASGTAHSIVLYHPIFRCDNLLGSYQAWMNIGKSIKQKYLCF